MAPLMRPKLIKTANLNTLKTIFGGGGVYFSVIVYILYKKN